MCVFAFIEIVCECICVIPHRSLCSVGSACGCERENVCVCVYLCVPSQVTLQSVWCVCVYERERECVCVSVCMYLSNPPQVMFYNV